MFNVRIVILLLNSGQFCEASQSNHMKLLAINAHKSLLGEIVASYKLCWYTTFSLFLLHCRNLNSFYYVLHISQVKDNENSLKSKNIEYLTLKVTLIILQWLHISSNTTSCLWVKCNIRLIGALAWSIFTFINFHVLEIQTSLLCSECHRDKEAQSVFYFLRFLGWVILPTHIIALIFHPILCWSILKTQTQEKLKYMHKC